MSKKFKLFIIQEKVRIIGTEALKIWIKVTQRL